MQRFKIAAVPKLGLWHEEHNHSKKYGLYLTLILIFYHLFFPIVCEPKTQGVLWHLC